MKTLILLSLALALPLSNAFAQNTCEIKASKAVAKIATIDNQGWVVHGANCEKAPNSSAILCEVFGSHEDGAGSKDFLVVLSHDCKVVYKIRLTGEE